MSSYTDSWEKFLNPATLRGNLISVSLFIAAFEMFKDRVIEKPASFFSDGFDKDGPILGEEYRKEVFVRSKSKLFASLLWFQEMCAIYQADIDAFDRIRQHRNEVAHELMSYLTDCKRNLDVSIFQELISLLAKIEKWWFEKFELGIDPEMLPEGANPSDVIPGPIWSLQLMLDIALGNEPEEGYYLNAFKNGKT